ncbi:MAG: bacterio-opsin activator domain-containing protein [Salinigranum sp.]
MRADDGTCRDTLVGAALEAFPMNVAVVDERGEIRFTNRSWREFAAENDVAGDAAMVGENYLAVAEAADDDDARRAVDGLRSVLAGHRRQFTLEYPCHSPEKKRWFTMWATRFRAGGDPYAVVVHVDITERKLAELTAERRAVELRRERTALEHLVDRLNGLVQDVLHALVQASTREEMEREVCERLAAADAYELAWMGAPDLAEERLRVRAWAGDLAVDPAAGFPLSEEGPSARAIRTGDLQTADGGAELAAILREGTADRDVGATVAVPLIYRESRYGVLTVYVRAGRDVDDRELAVLEALGTAIANAINALEHKRLLSTDEAVELEISVGDPDLWWCAASAALDCTLELTGSVQRGDGSVRLFVLADGPDADELPSVVGEASGATSVTLLAEHDDERLYEVASPETLVVDLLDHGAVTTAITAEGGFARLTLELPRETDARGAFEFLRDRFDRTELLAHRQIERPVRTRPEFVDALTDRLTDRQLTTLRTAYLSGYFQWPRPLSGQELAASMGIDRSTFHQHLRIAQRKVFEQLFDGESEGGDG